MANLQAYPFPEMVGILLDKSGKEVEVAFNHPAQFSQLGRLDKTMESSYSGSVIGGDGFNLTLNRYK